MDPSLRRGWRELRRTLLDFLFPTPCVACGARQAEPDASGQLCRICAAHLDPLHADGCPRCGEAPEPMGCAARHARLLPLRAARSAFRYRGTGGALVRRFKFTGAMEPADYMAQALAQRAPSWLGPARPRPMLVPIPLHAGRLAARGFDQAELLARLLARRLGWCAETANLVRARATLPQGDARVLSRERNVAAAFAILRPQAFAGRRILLVDDVTTSGATARACARQALRAGAASVELWTVCRGQSPGGAL